MKKFKSTIFIVSMLLIFQVGSISVMASNGKTPADIVMTLTGRSVEDAIYERMDIKVQSTSKKKKPAKLNDGKFTGTGTGFGGKIKSKVTIKKGKITNIKILSASQETPAYFNKAKSVINTMLNKQTYKVDAVSGATHSSKGIIQSVKNALKLAESK